MDNNKVLIYSNLIDQSPLRQYINNHKINFFLEEANTLKEVKDIVNRNISALDRPINLVVLGEVKSGKSTFINSFANKLVSRMDVIEATAIIHELKYNLVESVVVHLLHDNDITFYNLTDYHYYMSKNSDNLSLMKQIDKVSVTLPYEGLKKINLVDTPGLNTVTSDNAERTENYIINADAIIWIMNAHHLGQRDVQNKILKVRDFGKPIIGVINRIDEVDGDPEDLLDYVQEEMGFLFSKIFLTSAKLAWDGMLEGNIKKIQDSKITNVFEYINNNIEKVSDEFKEHSQVESSTIQLQRDIDVHKRAKKKLDTILHGAEEKISELDLFLDSLNNNVRQKIESWAQNGLYSRELKELRAYKSNKDYANATNKYLSEEYFESVIQTKHQELCNYLYNEWLTYRTDLIERERNSYLAIDNFDEITIRQSHSNNGLISDMKTGGLTVGSLGLGIAAYDALLAPWAAYYTLGLTTSVMVPPLLLAGVLAGGAFHFVNRNKRIDQRNQNLEENISNIKSFYKFNIMNKMIEQYQTINYNYYVEAKNMIIDLIEQGDTTKEVLEDLSEDIILYVNSLSSILL